MERAILSRVRVDRRVSTAISAALLPGSIWGRAGKVAQFEVFFATVRAVGGPAKPDQDRHGQACPEDQSQEGFIGRPQPERVTCVTVPANGPSRDLVAATAEVLSGAEVVVATVTLGGGDQACSCVHDGGNRRLGRTGRRRRVSSNASATSPGVRGHVS